MTETRFEVNGFLKMSEEDIFNDGCQPDSGNTFVGDERFSGSTVAGLVRALTSFMPFRTDDDAIDIDACDEPGRIDISGMETANGDEPSAHQIEQWKAGAYRLWYVTYSFNVERVTRETVSLMDGV